MQDVVVVGGSFAGLTAALQLGRTGRAVTIIDAQAPRNRLSPAAHGVPGFDGMAPGDILQRFRSDATAYPTVSVVTETVAMITGEADRFEVSLASGETLQARRILLTHGVVDVRPNLPGAQDAWGKVLLHCPYCHGYEVRDQPLAVLANHAMSGHQAQLLRADWSDDVTLLTGGPGTFDQTDVQSGDLKTDPRTVIALTPLNDGISVTFDSGEVTWFAAMFTAPLVSLSGTPADSLGCAVLHGPLGPFIHVGPMGQTSIPGVFAAGDCARAAHNVTSAIGDGSMAGIGCHQSLVFPDFIQPIEAAA
ncbi:NAD(P)/FAD-dependent oxidoreductase [Jannaschia sp. CCS1]|uniref:NAD(P)/FAD-dependent oxidoreductase n=1 Tax=Jannaschia sp. (strain CCS1) TaxID=290400 RepID=UPI000053B1C2|nr:NAD(P)/FAD-dependent oxidoreductase [Jannaschia sp. CCS1]ABD55172.1 FAD-dependent pyridine nucleotide-disulfide oxidoreductase [Jannaschia sp. CCS1]